MKKTVVLLLTIILVLSCLCAPAALAEEIANTGAMIDLTFVLKAVIALLAALVVAKLVPWIKSKTTAEQRATLKALYRTLIFAAEQLYGAGNGEVKLDYVISQLEERGYTVDRAEIEAAVWEYLNGFNVAIEDDDDDGDTDDPEAEVEEIDE